MKKQHTFMLYGMLAFICFYAFFYSLGDYPLLDIDETRYVHIAREMFNNKDFFTLYLNGEYFFEKPPLYFWLECFSFKFCNIISEFSARLPIVLLSLLPAALIISLGRKVKNDKFAFVSTAVLFTSTEYLFMTKLALLDSVLSSLTAISVFCYFYTFFTQQCNKKYFWVLTYLFSALAVLAKGIPGFAVPAVIIVVSSLVFKSYKETAKYSWGIFVFLAITLPWHLSMIKCHGAMFFDEYIMKHHILRFLGSDVIHRNQPWYFYILTLLWGLFPHIFVIAAQVLEYFTKFQVTVKNRAVMTDYYKYLTLNFIAIIAILFFFSLSGAKLITYILPIYPFFAVIAGAIWLKFIDFGNKAVYNSLIVLNSFLTLAALVLLFIKLLMPIEIYADFQKLQVLGLVIFIPFVVLNWVFLIKKRRFKIFLSLTFFMALLSGFLTPFVYEFNYTFGQNDLMEYAKLAQKNNYSISTYLTGRKYSLLFYGNKSRIEFQNDNDLLWLEKELNKKNNLLIIRNKNLIGLPVKIKEKGVKYSVIEKL